MNYWLVKTEPGAYSWQDLLKDKKTLWDGVRNYQARNNMRLMKKGEQVLFYHSINGKEIVGLAKVSKEHYQDPTDDTGKWSVVDIVPVKTFKNTIALSDLKAHPVLQNLTLVKHSRLSVMAVAKEHFDLIVKIGS